MWGANAGSAASAAGDDAVGIIMPADDLQLIDGGAAGREVSPAREPLGSANNLDMADIELMQAQLALLQQELSASRAAKRAADLELVELRTHLRTAERQLGDGGSGYYRLGQALVQGFTSRRGFGLLFRRLYALIRDEWRARPQRKSLQKSLKPQRVPTFGASLLRQVHERTTSDGPAGAARWVADLNIPPPVVARLLLEIAKECRANDLPTAVDLATRALARDCSSYRIKWLAFALMDAGAVIEPVRLLRGLKDSGAELTEVEQGRAQVLFARHKLLTRPPKLRPRSSRSGAGAGSRVLLVSNQILPLHWSIASCRVHLLARFLHAVGRSVTVACFNAGPRRVAISSDRCQIDNVDYLLIDDVDGELTVRFLTNEPPISFPAFLRQNGVGVIHASSQIATARSALAWGREYGLNVILDDAGDEMLAQAAGVNAASSEFTHLARKMKQVLLAEADAVSSPFTFLPISYGASSPGSIVRYRHHPVLTRQKIVGFLGEPFPEYDFNLLSTMCGRIADAAGQVRPDLLLAGVGRGLEVVEEAVSERGWDGHTLLLRRPWPSAFRSIYGAMDVFVAPTVEHPGTIERPPTEALLALAHGVPVVATNTVVAHRWQAAGMPVTLAERADGEALGEVVIRLLLNPAALCEARKHAVVWASARAGQNSFPTLYDKIA